MNLGTLLDHLSTYQKETLLRDILSHTFGSGGAIDPAKFLPCDFQKQMGDHVETAIATAEKNLVEIAIADAASPEDELLDDDIHTAFDEAASEINNGGANEQIKYLVVEAGWTGKQVVAALAEQAANLSEIPQ